MNIAQTKQIYFEFCSNFSKKRLDSMDTTVKDRLILFIKSQGISVNKFEKICGFSTGYVANMRKSLQPDKVMSIIQNFPALNTGWLFTGEGEMLKGQKENITTELQEINNVQNNSSESSVIINMLKKDVKYYADIADSRLEIIKTQTKVINALEKLLNLYEEEPKK
jgi:hypothetical protein